MDAIYANAEPLVVAKPDEHLPPASCSPAVPPVDALRAKVKSFVDTGILGGHPERLWVNPDCGLKTRDWPEVQESMTFSIVVTISVAPSACGSTLNAASRPAKGPGYMGHSPPVTILWAAVHAERAEACWQMHGSGRHLEPESKPDVDQSVDTGALSLQVAAAMKNMVKAASEMRTLHKIEVGQKATA